MAVQKSNQAVLIRHIQMFVTGDQTCLPHQTVEEQSVTHCFIETVVVARMRGESCDRYWGWGSVLKETGSDQIVGAATCYRLACLSAVCCRLVLFCLCNHFTYSNIHLCLYLLFQRPLTEFHWVARVVSIQYKQELWLCALKDTSLDMMYSCFTYPCFTGTSVWWFPLHTFESCWYMCSSSFYFVSIVLFHCCLCPLNLLIRHLIVIEVGGFNPGSHCHVCCLEDILYSSILLTFF